MTTLIIKVDDDRAESLKKILNEIPYVREVEDKSPTAVTEPVTQYEKIKRILDDAKGKDLFKDIEDPVKWQRAIRKEWDRDF